MRIKSGIHAGQGLGDSVAKFTQKTGIDRLTKRYEEITGKSCGCDQRRQALNNLFPFNVPS